jgi:DNA-binding transcriptional LysR family regulator
MRNSQLHSLDLNLLVVLDELLRSKSTVKTAQTLGRTQSSVSHALARLREIFADPLFVRVGASLRPTTFAEEISEPLRAALESFEQLVAQSAPIDPTRLKRTFTISATDFAEVVFLPSIMRRLRQEAPDVDIIVRFTGADVDRAVQAGEIDLAIGTNFQILSGILIQRFTLDRFVCVVRRNNPAFDTTITLDEFVAAHHVLVPPRGLPGSTVDDMLLQLGKERRVVLRTPHFAAAVLVVSQSDLIVTLPWVFARVMADYLPIKVLEPPLNLAPLSYGIIYAATRQKDPTHQWLRSCVLAACREVQGIPPKSPTDTTIDENDM